VSFGISSVQPFGPTTRVYVCLHVSQSGVRVGYI